MSVFVVMAIVVGALIVIALVVLVLDIGQGAVGGRRTLSRARRMLVVATDDDTEGEGRRWIAEQQRERPGVECVLVRERDGSQLLEQINRAIEEHEPDALVMVRHAEDRRGTLAGTWGELKEHMALPVDAIYLEPTARGRTGT